MFLLIHEFSNYDLKYHIFKEGMWYTALFSKDHFLNSKALVAKQGYKDSFLQVPYFQEKLLIVFTAR